MLIPSIDLVRGRAVRLRNGRELELVSDADPRDLARRFGRVGEVAVIDLDAARGTGDNIALLEEMCGLAPCRVGGGIRDVERAHRLLRAGARKLIIGTCADPEFLQQFNPARLIAAVDARHDRVVDHGWTVDHDESPIARARRLEPFVGGLLYTIVELAGTMEGSDLERVRLFARAVSVPVTAGGGIASLDDVAALDHLGVDAQAGMALYQGRFTPAEGLLAVIAFETDGGTVPTVVQDVRDGRVLLVAASSRETVLETLETGDVVLCPRAREGDAELPVPPHRLVRVELECRRRALLYHVEPVGPTCERGMPSCFGERPFSLRQLAHVILERVGAADGDGYTQRLVEDPVARRAKVLEEARALIEAQTPAEARDEAADLLYHMLVDLAARGVSLGAVVTALDARRRRAG